MKAKYYFIEQIVTDSSTKRGYSLPNVIQNHELLKELIDTLESNLELKLMAFADDSNPKYASATAATMWDILKKYPIGQKLLKTYPGIENYRISGALTRGAFFKKDAGEAESPFKQFDNWANKTPKQSPTSMPSFKDYINNPETYNPHQVMGGVGKHSPVKN